ncbi:MAG: hypothetical protein QM817_25220 [Archangium sp.]
MKLRCYDDHIDEAVIPKSVFLAGPTARGVLRTPWRAEAIAWFEQRGFDGTVVIPEFRDGLFDQLASKVFGGATSEAAIPGMRTTSHNILSWETAGIERSTVVLFWMPFAIHAEDDPRSLPGFTTRAEVSRELQRDPKRLVLGMPDGALSSSHIRYHAHHAGVTMHRTLEETLRAALALATENPGTR